MQLKPSRYRLYNRFFKRPVDIVCSFFFLSVFIFIFFFIALAIIIDSKGPVFYAQERIGRGEKSFKLYKLRTMIEGAHEMAGEVSPISDDNPFIQHENDPRVTRVGRFLRRFSIDELPQVFNVLKGDMSFVGPRPFIPEETQLLKPEYMYRYKVRPGLTGLAQINGRNDLTLDERMAKDRFYVDNVNIWLDIKILFMTIPTVLRKDGVY